MTPTYTNTTRLRFRIPQANQKVNDFTAILGALGADVDAGAVGWASGLASALPAAGTRGRIYNETNTGIVRFDNGSTWDIWASPWQAYTPLWTAVTTSPAIGNGALNGRYAVLGKICHLHIYLVCGSTTNAGQGAMQFSLPLAAQSGSGEQELTAKLFAVSPSLNFAGVATVSASQANPMFPTSAASSAIGFFSNDAPQVPNVGGVFSLTAGSTLVLQGFYETA